MISAHTTQTSKAHLAPLVFVGSLFFYTLQDGFIKALPQEYSIFQIIFFRSLFSFLPLVALARWEYHQDHISQDRFWQTERPKFHLLRATLMTLSLIFYVLGFRHLPLAKTYVLSYTNPLFMALFAPFFLGEKVRIKKLIAASVGFIGVIITMQPNVSFLETYYELLPVLSGAFVALATVQAKKLAEDDSNALIVAYYLILSLVVCGLALPFVWQPMDAKVLGYLLAAGLLGGIAQYGFIHAFRLGKVSTLAPFDYVSLLFAMSLGYMVWNEIPEGNTLIGGTMIILAGLITLRYRANPLRRAV